ncbi:MULTISPECIES: spore germination protein GerPB [Bacillus]|uniref:spore germination protein GerPB n=1 Tax=Bacillus TaxID=1386 RepID=UPI0030FB427E
MNIYVQQSIQIRMIKIGSMTNSSVLQIGTLGSSRSIANLYNTGGFTEPAPELSQNILNKPYSTMPILVPLQPPTA